MPSHVVRILALALTLSGAAHAEALPALDTAHALTRRATRTMLEGDAAGAERIYADALREIPDFPAAHLGLGHVALARHEPEAALRHYVAARGGFERLGTRLIGPESDRHGDARAAMAALARDSERIREQLVQESARREELELRLRANEVRIRQLEFVTPLEEREGVIVLPAELHYHLGNALFKLRDLASAVEAWRTSARLRPDLAILQGNLAVALWNLGRLDEARAAAAEARRLGQALDPRLEARLRE